MLSLVAGVSRTDSLTEAQAAAGATASSTIATEASVSASGPGIDGLPLHLLLSHRRLRFKLSYL